MTRFLMSLQESVDLVEYAFSYAQPGDLFVRNAPACTVQVLAEAVAGLLGIDEPKINTVGARHGEKFHETLLSTEERIKADDQGDYFRVPLDARSLEYELYFEEGEQRSPMLCDYTSANTERLGVEATKELLLRLPEMQRMVGALA